MLQWVEHIHGMWKYKGNISPKGINIVDFEQDLNGSPVVYGRKKILWTHK